jgi:solute:Na+ symporter, SSS family
MGWVTHAMATIIGLTMGLNRWQATIALFAVTAFYSALSGLWGVVVTDAFQFVLAMAGSVALAVFALRAVGGLAVLEEGLSAKFFGGGPTAIMPDLDSTWMAAMTLSASSAPTSCSWARHCADGS